MILHIISISIGILETIKDHWPDWMEDLPLITVTKLFIAVLFRYIDRRKNLFAALGLSDSVTNRARYLHSLQENDEL